MLSAYYLFMVGVPRSGVRGPSALSSSSKLKCWHSEVGDPSSVLVHYSVLSAILASWHSNIVAIMIVMLINIHDLYVGTSQDSVL